MQLRKLTYVVNVDTTKAHQKIKNIDTRFSSLIKNLEKIDTMLGKKDFSKNNVFSQIGSQIDKNTSNMMDFNKQLGKSVTYSRMLKANLGLSKAPKMPIEFPFGQPRLPKQPKGRGGDKGGFEGGLAYGAREHPISSALMRGLGMSTLLHFGGIGAGVTQMVTEGVKKVVIQGMRYTYQMSQQASDTRQGALEARATSRTFITNKAEEEGVDAQDAFKKASANAKKFAQTTLFTERQALIAQSAMAEGGLSTKKAGDINSVKNVLDATIGRYNKVNITEGNIQMFINQLATASLSGKFGKLKTRFETAGEDWISTFEKANTEKRWDMMLSYLEKTSGGLADTILREDTALARLINQQNRQETLMSSTFGETGMKIKTFGTSISNNLTPLMNHLAIGLKNVLNVVDKITNKGAQRASQQAISFGLSEEVRNKISSAKTDEEAKKILAKELPKRWQESTTVLTKERAEKEVNLYNSMKKEDREVYIRNLLQYKDRVSEQLEAGQEYQQYNPNELIEMNKFNKSQMENVDKLLQSLNVGEKAYNKNNSELEANTEALKELNKQYKEMVQRSKGASNSVETGAYYGKPSNTNERSLKPR